MIKAEPRYRVDGQIEDRRVCYKAERYVRCWTAAHDDPRVFDGECDPMDDLYVKAWGATLEIEGYRMEYDAEEEGFWVIRIADGKAVDILYY